MSENSASLIHQILKSILRLKRKNMLRTLLTSHDSADLLFYNNRKGKPTHFPSQSFSHNLFFFSHMRTDITCLSQHFCEASSQRLFEERTAKDSQRHLNLHWINEFSNTFITTVHAHWYVSYTDHFTQPIQTRTEPLGNQRVFTEYFNLNGAVFIII